jgi:hypothetical protein
MERDTGALTPPEISTYNEGVTSCKLVCMLLSVLLKDLDARTEGKPVYMQVYITVVMVLLFVVVFLPPVMLFEAWLKGGVLVHRLRLRLMSDEQRLQDLKRMEVHIAAEAERVRLMTPEQRDQVRVLYRQQALLAERMMVTVREAEARQNSSSTKPR